MGLTWGTAPLPPGVLSPYQLHEYTLTSPPAPAPPASAVQEVFPAFFARVLALRLPERQAKLAQHEQTAYLLFMINAFQSLEDEMVRAQVRLGAALAHCESMFRVWNMQVSEVGWQL